MAAKDNKLIMNGGAYSLKYQLLEQERLRRFQQEQKDNTKSVRERAHLLSKQTQQRRRALEEKKQAMAKAEEERRKAALEERRRQQKEATMRFRSAISRQPKHSRSHITLEAIHSHPRQQTPPNNVSRTNSTNNNKSSPSDRVVYGREVEIPHHPALLNMATFTVMKDPPDLDEVLESIRGGRTSDHTSYSDHTPSIESIILPSPEPTNSLTPETRPLFHKPTPHNSIISNNSSSNVSINSNSSSDGSTISLHDSIDEPIQVINNPPIDHEASVILEVNVNTPDELETRPLIKEKEPLVRPVTNGERPSTDEEHPTINDKQLEIKEKGTSTDNNEQPSTSDEYLSIINKLFPNHSLLSNHQEGCSKEETETTEESQKKGILKKASCSSLSRGSSTTSSGKRVRFSEAVNEHQRQLARTNNRDSTSILIPKMRISLNRAKLNSINTQHVLSSTVTKLGGGSGRNGIVIHVPATQAPPTSSGGGMYHHQPDGTNVWSSMSAYVHDEVDLTPPERKILSNNSSNNNNVKQLPVKLWKRSSKNTTSQGESVEEKRLMESIELINNRLRALPTNGMPPVNMEPSVMDPPYGTRSPPIQQYKRPLTKPSPTRHRTRYK